MLLTMMMPCSSSYSHLHITNISYCMFHMSKNMCDHFELRSKLCRAFFYFFHFIRVFYLFGNKHKNISEYSQQQNFHRILPLVFTQFSQQNKLSWLCFCFYFSSRLKLYFSVWLLFCRCKFHSDRSQTEYHVWHWNFIIPNQNCRWRNKNERRGEEYERRMW